MQSFLLAAQGAEDLLSTEQLHQAAGGFTAEISDGIAILTGGSSQGNLIFFGGCFLFSIFLGRAVTALMKRRVRKGDGSPSGVSLFAGPAGMFLFFTGLYISIIPYLTVLPEESKHQTLRLFGLVFGVIAAWAVYRSVNLLTFFMKGLAKAPDNSLDLIVATMVGRILKVVVVVIAVLFIGQNVLGMNITTLIAGAGVAGLAVAFAAQDTIANFFGAIMLMVDKPFDVNDFVKVDGYEGFVRRVGLRSSRIETLDGHIITVPNKNVAGTSIVNVSGRKNIKSVFSIGLTYDTPADKVERAMAVLHEIFDNHEGMAPELPPLIHFTEFKDYSLNIQVIVWHHPADVVKNLDWLSDRNLEILRRFNAEGIDMAFPTSTTYLAGDPKRPLRISDK